MKIKMTIIAFFVSVLMLSSCMKNEVSPGIEEIRSAYASLITAKAESERLIGVANALYREAEAEEFNIKNAYLLDSLATLIQQEVERMKKEMQDEKDLIVKGYFDKYTAALGNYAAMLDTVSGTMKSVVSLQYDLDNGQTRSLDSAQVVLASYQDELVALQAEIALATASLGDPDAIAARVLELTNDTISLSAEISLKKIELEELRASWQTEWTALEEAFPVDDDSPFGEPEEDDCTAVEDAQLAYDTALEAFLDGRSLDPNDGNEKPDFWLEALDSVVNAKDHLDKISEDTSDYYDAWKAASDIIEIGEDSINDAITELEELITSTTEDSINSGPTKEALDALILDTLNTYLADSTSREALVQAKLDTATLAGLSAMMPGLSGELLVIYNDLMTKTNSDPDAYVNDAEEDFETDSTTYALAVVTYHTESSDLINELASIQGRIDGYVIDSTYLEDFRRPQVILAIEEAKGVVEDLWSDYQHVLGFVTDAETDLANAEAYKESRRADYEQWRIEYWETHLAKLAEDLADAEETCYNDFVADHAAWQILYDAYLLAYESSYDLDMDILSMEAEIGYLRTIILAYQNAEANNDKIISSFEDRIDVVEGNIKEALDGIAVIEKAYAEGEIDLDHYENLLIQQRARLVTIQAQIDHWKALLDEAIANS